MHIVARIATAPAFFTLVTAVLCTVLVSDGGNIILCITAAITSWASFVVWIGAISTIVDLMTPGVHERDVGEHC